MNHSMLVNRIVFKFAIVFEKIYKNANARTSHCMQKGELEYKIKTEETK